MSPHGSQAPLLEVRDLCVSYGKIQALTDASLRVRDGQIVTVIGPNGAGKTTLLSAIMGVLPSRGCIAFAGADASAPTIKGMIGRGVSLVPESRALFGSMSVEDNLRLGGFRIIADLRRQGVSILLIEQNARAALRVADYAYVLELGKIVMQGPAAELENDPRVVAAYLGIAGKHQEMLAT